jgi:hypothetical protein
MEGDYKPYRALGELKIAVSLIIPFNPYFPMASDVLA